jgi:hypothetical protein
MTVNHSIQGVIHLAARRALRHSLADLGCAGAELFEVASEVKGLYYVPALRRLVRVQAAILPKRPSGLALREARQLLGRARDLEAEAWQAMVLLRPTFLPQAVIWLKLGSGSREAGAGAGTSLARTQSNGSAE